MLICEYNQDDITHMYIYIYDKYKFAHHLLGSPNPGIKHVQTSFVDFGSITEINGASKKRKKPWSLGESKLLSCQLGGVLSVKIGVFPQASSSFYRKH